MTNTSNKPSHVVYKIVDPRNDEVIYIGSGTGSRPRISLTASHVPQIKRNCKHLNLFVSDLLAEDVARYSEMRLIDKYRPRFNSILYFLKRPAGFIATGLGFNTPVGSYRTQEQIDASREAVLQGSKNGGATFTLNKSPERKSLGKKLAKLGVYVSRAEKSGDRYLAKQLESDRKVARNRIALLDRRDNPDMVRRNGRLVRVT